MSPTLGEMRRFSEYSQNANDFVALAATMLRARGQPLSAMANAPGLSPRVKELLARPMQKAAATSISLADMGSSDYPALQSAFLESCALFSAFERINADHNFLIVPERARVRVLASAPTAAIIGESEPVPVMHMSADVDVLEPIKVVSHIAIDDDFFRLGGTNTMIGNELRRAVGKQVDTVFLSLLVSTDTPSAASTGTDAASVLSDLEVALQSLTIGADSKLYLVVSPSVVDTLALSRTSEGLATFPQVAAPSGGSIAGIRVVSSNAATTDAYLLDASQIAVAPGTLELLQSINAVFQMDDNPTSGEPASLVSMFQRNMTALKAVRYFNAKALRATAVAIISGMVTA
jgi:hypothetical protein